MVLNAHNSILHGETSQIAAFNRTWFCIPSCRNLVRKTFSNIVKCNMFTVKPNFLLMGDLPKERVSSPSKVLQNVGLDFRGPFACEKLPQNVEKPYMGLFVCFASRTVHIEAVTLSDKTGLHSCSTEICISSRLSDTNKYNKYRQWQ